MPDESTSPAIEVRNYRPDDEPHVVELFERCFERPRSIEDWRWRYEDAPQQPEMHVLTVDGRVMGFMGRLRLDIWVDGRRGLLSRGSDLMVDPTLRGTGVSSALSDPRGKSALADVRCGFPSAGSRRAREKTGLPMSVGGELPQWVRWQSGHAVHADAAWIPAFVGAIGAATLRLRSFVADRVRRPRAVVEVDLASFDQWASAFDDLALASRDFATALVIRDARHLRWRWLDRPGMPFQMMVVPNGAGGIDGFVVYGVRAGQGRIVDLLAANAPAMQSLLVAAIDRLSQDGAERVLLELADPRPWVAPILRRNGFLRRGRGTTMTLKAAAPWVPERVGDLRAWYVTLGDTDHD